MFWCETILCYVLLQILIYWRKTNQIIKKLEKDREKKKAE